MIYPKFLKNNSTIGITVPSDGKTDKLDLIRLDNAYKKLNIEAKEYDDGFLIEGKSEINKDVALETYLDHRLAMTYYVLSLLNKKETKIIWSEYKS